MLINFCNSFNQFAGDEMINSKLLSIILYSSTTIVYVLIFWEKIKSIFKDQNIQFK